MKRSLILGGGILLLGLAFSGQGFMLMILTILLVWGIAAMGIVILTGQSGQISLGHGAFMAIGAYATALAARAGLPPWLGALAGAALALLSGLLIGLPALRLKGFYLAIATIAFGVGTSQLIAATDSLGGHAGLYGIPPLAAGERGAFLSFLATLAVFIVLLRAGQVLVASRAGLRMRMARDSEVAARAFGVDVSRTKLLAFMASAAFCSVAGSLYAQVIGYIQPADFGLSASVNLLTMAIVGGATMFEGALLGSTLIMGLVFLLSRSKVPLSLVYGILLIGSVLLLPKGLAFEIRLAWHRWMQRPIVALLMERQRRKRVPGSCLTTASGLRVFYTEAGEGEPLLYIHGNTASHLWFREVMDIPGFRTIAPDLPNFGRTGRIGTSSIEDYADRLAEFLDTLGLPSVHIVGHSLGGGVAQALAVRHPGRVRRQFLLDACPVDGLHTPEEYYPVIELMKKDYFLLKKGIESAMGTRRDRRLLALLTGEALLLDPASYEGNARALDALDFRPLLDGRRIPTLVVVGDKDRIIDREDAERTALAWEGRSLVVEGVGHSLVLEAPERFKSLVLEFFG